MMLKLMLCTAAGKLELPVQHVVWFQCVTHDLGLVASQFSSFTVSTALYRGAQQLF